MVIVGREEAGLYKLNQMSFLSTEVNKYLLEVVNVIPTMQCFINIMVSKAFINKKVLIQMLVPVYMPLISLICMID